jgi:molybdopterin synthase catalytic subunit
MHFDLTTATIDPIPLRQALLHQAAGAYCSYEGWVRDHNSGRSVQQLEYLAYPQLAPAVGAELLQEAKEKFAIESAALVHRIGLLAIGDFSRCGWA